MDKIDKILPYRQENNLVFKTNELILALQKKDLHLQPLWIKDTKMKQVNSTFLDLHITNNQSWTVKYFLALLYQVSQESGPEP